MLLNISVQRFLPQVIRTSLCVDNQTDRQRSSPTFWNEISCQFKQQRKLRSMGYRALSLMLCLQSLPCITDFYIAWTYKLASEFFKVFLRHWSFLWFFDSLTVGHFASKSRMDWNLAALISVFGKHGLIRQVSFPDNMADAGDVKVSLLSESTKLR